MKAILDTVETEDFTLPGLIGEGTMKFRFERSSIKGVELLVGKSLHEFVVQFLIPRVSVEEAKEIIAAATARRLQG